TGSVYDTTGSNLTDQERVTSETYIHEGISQETKDAACNESKEMKDACAGRETHAWANWVPLIIKAYGMVVGMMPGEYSVEKTSSSETGRSSEAGGNTSTNQTQGQGQEKEKEKKQDYCKYIVVATELLASFQQTSAQENLANVPGNNANAQTEQLYKAKRSHEERAKTAEIQAYGWSAGGVCYVGMLALGGAYQDISMIIKSVLTALAAVYFWFEVKHQNDAAAKLQAIIDRMPKAGDCNPVTQTNCFCSQESSKSDVGNYIKYCKSSILAAQQAQGASMACINKQAQVDAECLCVQNNSCFDVEFMNMIGGLKFGKSAEEVLGKSTRDLSRGQLSNGNLGSGSIAQSAAARAKNALRSIRLDKLPKISGFNSDQIGLIDALSNEGFPRPLAAMAVGVKVPGSSKYASKLQAFQVDSSALMAARHSDYGNAKVLSYGGGGGSFKKTTGKKDEFDFKKLLQKKEAEASSDNILKFAERASDSAQISKNPDTVIFDIISNRYRLSGWRRVNFE
ncbi:MAG: hypothetical protein AABY86_08915, partial [Bdellovibrionota bacterium]